MFKKIIATFAAFKTNRNWNLEEEVSFCDNCGEVCGPACRIEQRLEESRRRLEPIYFR